jgi:hypothetical protein
MSLRLAFAVGGLLLALGGGIAAASTALDPLAIERSLEPSQIPALLGPISVEGRVGWACEPEKAASMSSAREAHLPGAEPAH